MKAPGGTNTRTHSQHSTHNICHSGGKREPKLSPSGELPKLREPLGRIQSVEIERDEAIDFCHQLIVDRFEARPLLGCASSEGGRIFDAPMNRDRIPGP